MCTFTSLSIEDLILFEDDHLLLINKPPSLVVNRSETQKEKTLQDYFEEYFKIEWGGIGNRAGIVHRLDKETSGLLVVAKTQKSFERLQLDFKKRRVEKIYTALVHGHMEILEGEIEAPIGRNPKNRLKFAVVEGARPALTQFKKVALYCKDLPRTTSETFTLLEIYPKTGRTHQVRVHLAAFGHPIVSDNLYAGRKRSRGDREWCPRLFLHALKLKFRHPETEEVLEFQAELAADLREVLGGLKLVAM